MNPTTVKAAQHLIELAFLEDLGPGPGLDTTSEIVVPANAGGSASIVSRQSGIACGLELIPLVIERFKTDITATLEINDGDVVSTGTVAAILDGNAQDILKAERTLLNFMGRLSGIASLTRQFVDLVKHTSARIYDTRKTVPGWRHLEKYAVQCGGGENHRMGLYDAVLIKDNHLAVVGNKTTPDPSGWITKVRQAVEKIRKQFPLMLIQIEVDTMQQFNQVMSLLPNIILLDNMNTEQLREAVELRNSADHPDHQTIELEASGGVHLDTVKSIAETGIERISVGAITHSAINFDWSMDWSVR